MAMSRIIALGLGHVPRPRNFTDLSQGLSAKASSTHRFSKQASASRFAPRSQDFVSASRLRPGLESRMATKKKHPYEDGCFFLEEPLGLEPRTPCLKGRCSNQLSYGSASEFTYGFAAVLQSSGKTSRAVFVIPPHNSKTESVSELGKSQ